MSVAGADDAVVEAELPAGPREDKDDDAGAGARVVASAPSFVVALVARLAVIAWGHDFPPAGDGTYYDTLARRIASGQGYTWLWPDGTVTYAAHYPVGYPALVSLGYRIFGPYSVVAMVENALLGALSAAAIHVLAGAATRSRARALAAGLVVALHPALISPSLLAGLALGG